jgi:hypothetical protein
MAIQSQSKLQVYKVTEWRNGMVWKTAKVGEIWVADEDSMDIEKCNEIARANGGDMLVSMPTTASFDQCHRTVKIEEPLL